MLKGKGSRCQWSIEAGKDASLFFSCQDVTGFSLALCTLKGVSVCFSMLKAALCGNYVNFGVFRLYGDNALDKAFGMFVKLLLSVSQRDLMVSCFFSVGAN